MAAPDEPPPTPLPANLPANRPPAGIELGASAPIERADIPELCERAQGLLADQGTDRLVCDVGAILEPDAVTVDALARLQLTAMRLGREMQLGHASRKLEDLLAFMGLDGVVPSAPGSGLEAGRETEERKVDLRVEEEADPGDPIA